MKDPHVILCPVDFSPLSTAVLRHAAALARDTGARLVLLHVIEPLLVQAASMTYDTTYLQDETHRSLSVLAAGLGQGVHRTPPVPRVCIGLPPAEILQAVADEHADLVVMGTQGHRGAARLFFGSTTLKVLRETSARVLVIPPDTHGLVRDASDGTELAIARVVAAVDFSESTGVTVQAAADMAARRRARLVLAHVVPEPHGLNRWAQMVAEHQQRRIERANLELELLAHEVRPQVGTVDRVVTAGHADQELAQLADFEPGTLLVMGLRRGPGVFAPQPGSTAYRVLCLTTAPVLVVPRVGR
jgi:nucleotide-binding universal stress UspA family protein